MADTTTELEVLNQIVDVLGGTSGQHETVVPVLEDIRDLLSGGGGGGGGYNPSLSVGRADALTGADETAQWVQRESTGSGAATVRSVQGATVMWNQLVSADTSTVTIPSGHKYLSVIGGTSAIATSDGTAISVTGGTDQVFDLTAMFGAGNEPTTVAEFERMFPASYYPYSAPTLKPVRIAGIASTDANGNALDGVVWTAQTLRAAGTIRDELTAGELVTRVGVVDLGTVAWMYDNANLRFATLEPISYLPSTSNTANVTTELVGVNLLPAGGTTTSDGYTIASQRIWMRIADTNPEITTPSDFTAWLATHCSEMYYQLATPTTQHISTALPMTYKVQQGGTEAIVVPDGEVSAAPVLTVSEGESAAELVMDALACIATPDGPVATSNHAVNTYLTMQGKLYKVTRAIAVGETIAEGTNVSETTVMAELLALTV